MKINPNFSIRLLSDCEPNQLVKVIGHGGVAGRFSLVADVVDQPASRSLIVIDDGAPAFYIPEKPQTMKVLAFEEKPTLTVDPFGPFEAQPYSLFGAPGCVSRHDNRWLMRVREYFSDFRPRQGSLDLEKGMLINAVEELNGVAFFGKWCITIPSPEEYAPAIEVAKFEWEAPEAR